MNAHWNKILIKVIVWLAGEILLGSMGLDTLADYSEFLLEYQVHPNPRDTIAIISSHTIGATSWHGS